MPGIFWPQFASYFVTSAGLRGFCGLIWTVPGWDVALLVVPALAVSAIARLDLRDSAQYGEAEGVASEAGNAFELVLRESRAAVPTLQPQ